MFLFKLYFYFSDVIQYCAFRNNVLHIYKILVGKKIMLKRLSANYLKK